MEFLDMLEKDPEALTKITIAEFAERGGFEAPKSSCGSSCAERSRRR